MTPIGTTQLVRYNEARRALVKAKATDECCKIRNDSDKLAAYARVANDRAMEIDAVEIRIRAERRLGELIKSQKETVGLNRGMPGPGRGIKPSTGKERGFNQPPTLADAGITRKLSSHAQKLAAIPELAFEKKLTDWRDAVTQGADRVSASLLKNSNTSRPRRVGRKNIAENEPVISVAEGGLYRTRAGGLVSKIERLIADEFTTLSDEEQDLMIRWLERVVRDLKLTRPEKVG